MEKVLAFKTDLLKNIGPFQGYTMDVSKYLNVILNPQHHMYLERNLAEKNYQYKQLISYVALRYKKSLFSYVRGKAGSEKRLIGRRSIALGGHIDQADRRLSLSRNDLFLLAARRELSEEVKIESPYREQMVALINDDSTNVGKVHFGILLVWDLEEPKVTKIEEEIIDTGFYSFSTLKGLLSELESWSVIALHALEDSLTSPYER